MPDTVNTPIRMSGAEIQTTSLERFVITRCQSNYGLSHRYTPRPAYLRIFRRTSPRDPSPVRIPHPPSRSDLACKISSLHVPRQEDLRALAGLRALLHQGSEDLGYNPVRRVPCARA